MVTLMTSVVGTLYSLAILGVIGFFAFKVTKKRRPSN